MIVESLTKKELAHVMRHAKANLLHFKKMLNVPRDNRIGKLNDFEVQTFIMMEENNVAIIGMAMLYVDSDVFNIGKRINIHI